MILDRKATVQGVPLVDIFGAIEPCRNVLFDPTLLANELGIDHQHAIRVAATLCGDGLAAPAEHFLHKGKFYLTKTGDALMDQWVSAGRPTVNYFIIRRRT